MDKSKILFDWDASKFNLYDEYLKAAFMMTSNDIKMLNKDERNELLYDKSDFLDKQSLCNELLSSELLKFIESFEV